MGWESHYKTPLLRFKPQKLWDLMVGLFTIRNFGGKGDQTILPGAKDQAG